MSSPLRRCHGERKYFEPRQEEGPGNLRRRDMDHENPPPPYDLGEPPCREGVDELKRLLAEAFPAEAQQTDEEALDLWGSDEASSLWFNGFARRTNEAILRRDAAVVSAHFDFFAAQLTVAGADVASIIDVSYVENLLSRMDGSVRAQGMEPDGGQSSGAL